MADGFDKEALEVAHKVNDAFVKAYYSTGQRTSHVQIIVREALQAAYEKGRQHGYVGGEWNGKV